MPARIEMLDRLMPRVFSLPCSPTGPRLGGSSFIEKYFGSERFALVQGRSMRFRPSPKRPSHYM